MTPADLSGNVSPINIQNSISPDLNLYIDQEMSRVQHFGPHHRRTFSSFDSQVGGQSSMGRQPPQRKYQGSQMVHLDHSKIYGHIFTDLKREMVPISRDLHHVSVTDSLIVYSRSTSPFRLFFWRATNSCSKTCRAAYTSHRRLSWAPKWSSTVTSTEFLLLITRT